MSWNKIKGLFVEQQGGADAEGATSEDVDAVLADLRKYELPAGQVGTLPEGTAPAALSGQIDFQALYDQAGIPNTDEVESLERFLQGLDTSLPQTSRLAAAKAFLGAVGKSPNDVVNDAGRKISVVRAVAEAKLTDTKAASADRKNVIADLQRQIDEHKAAIQGFESDLESVKQQCTVEESRLQGARVFFGNVPGN
jgi:hypothetical protein